MQITAQMVKELRQATGAAILDCKNALVEHDGDVEKATEYLRKKGLAAVEKKSSRAVSEGLVETYTHPGGRVGVMVEVNCETDFVARTPQFQAFTHDLTLHIAFHDPGYIKEEDVPEAVSSAKHAELRTAALAEGKPEAIVDKIVAGRMAKWYGETVLLAQPWIKDDDKTVKDTLNDLIAELRENIVIRRFARFEVGRAEEGEE